MEMEPDPALMELSLWKKRDTNQIIKPINKIKKSEKYWERNMILLEKKRDDGQGGRV